MYDTNLTNDPYETKQSSMHAYKAIYSGDQVKIHFLYSETLNIVFCTMLYGLHMPILFPLAALSIFNKRFVQKILLGRFYKLPPSMNDVMTKQVFFLMQFAPMCLIFNGYWLLDNRQIFDNVWTYKMSSQEHMKSKHFISLRICQSTPLLFICFLSLLYLAVTNLISLKTRIKLGMTIPY